MSVFARASRASVIRSTHREVMARRSTERLSHMSAEGPRDMCPVCHGVGYVAPAWQEENPSCSLPADHNGARLKRGYTGEIPLTGLQKQIRVIRDEAVDVTSGASAGVLGDVSQETISGAVPLHTETYLNIRALKHVIPFILFCGVCGLVLSYIEQPTEERQVQHHKSNSIALRAAIELAVQEGRLDVSVLNMLDDVCKLDLQPYDEVDLKWRFPGATFFVTTVVTTIGYGNYAPVTDGGKAFTCIMAILGISWFGFLLALVSERIESFLIGIWWRARVCIRRPPDPEELLTPWDMMIYSMIANVLYILLSAVLGWSSGVLELGNSLYMAVITFTTVGLGDYCPPFFDPGRPLWYKSMAYLGAGVLALVGLALLATLLSSIEFWVSRRLLVMTMEKSKEGTQQAAVLVKRTTQMIFEKERKNDDLEASSVVPVASAASDLKENTGADGELMEARDAKMAASTGQPEAHGQPNQGDSSLPGTASPSAGPPR